MKKYIPLIFFCGYLVSASAQEPLINNPEARKGISLDGSWQYIVDPYLTGFYDYRFHERRQDDRDAYWNSDVPRDRTDKLEFQFTPEYSLHVPGDWNSQVSGLLYYEGSVWYRKLFDYRKSSPQDRVFLYFGAVNYRADVYLNGHKLGMHLGGFTPFNFAVPDSLLKERDNFLVVKVDNTRHVDEVPTVNTDWWNYGGITRDVRLLELPPAFIRDYAIHLAPGTATDAKEVNLEGWVKLNAPAPGNKVDLEIPGLNLQASIPVVGDSTHFSVRAPQPRRWSPDNPYRYEVAFRLGNDEVKDQIGFRTIETRGGQILLNGRPVFLRGISMHEEIPQEGRRAWSRQDALQLLGWARQLGCNMVRLAHYPHNENTIRVADSLGIMVWSEIPVYWTIQFDNPAVFEKARQQLTENIARDHNRACIILWSVGNETPVNPVRTDFMRRLIETAHGLDPTRLVTAALQIGNTSKDQVRYINDPLGAYVDVLAFNEYLGWYGGLPSECSSAAWNFKYDKPVFISETGGGAKWGFHGDSLTRWSEEYQAWLYREQVAMMKRMPSNFAGMSPWILADFRSPKRNNQVFQQGWNIKGLIDREGRRKQAFWILQQFYQELEKKAGAGSTGKSENRHSKKSNH